MREPMPEPLRRWQHRWPRALARALLPSTCALCGALGDAVVCPPCHAHYVAPHRTRCPACANPLSGLDTGMCAACLAAAPEFDATIAAVDYGSPLDGLVLQLKFGARLALAPWFAQMLRDAVLARPGPALPDVLCPVPLGPRRLVERGFNQALEIARPLAASLGIELGARLALRAQDTAAQSGVAPAQRRQNVRNAFTVADAWIARIDGRHVGVVDDVMTSGHTLGELAATLKRNGAARVTNFVFARTPPH